MSIVCKIILLFNLFCINLAGWHYEVIIQLMGWWYTFSRAGLILQVFLDGFVYIELEILINRIPSPSFVYVWFSFFYFKISKCPQRFSFFWIRNLLTPEEQIAFRYYFLKIVQSSL